MTPMRRRAIISAAAPAVLALGLVVAGCFVDRLVNRIGDVPLPDVSASTAALHADSFVVDLHADPLLWRRDLTRRGTHGHVDLPRLTDGGVDLQVFGIVTKVPVTFSIERNSARTPDAITLLALTTGWPRVTWSDLRERALLQAQDLDALVARSEGRLVPIRTRGDLERLSSANADAIGALLAVEGAHALGDDEDGFDALVAAGVRMIGLTHFFDNAFAGSAHGTAKGGLTERGRALIAAMERRGVAVDLAHASAATIDDVLSIATRPLVASHTGVRATCDNARNLSDAQIRGIAAKGGVIGVGFWDTAVCDDSPEAIATAVRHVVEVAGPDHAALGSDFDGAVKTPFDVARLAVVTQALADAGLPPDTVRKVLGDNARRVLAATLPPD
jgi:membrane dipeptidase